jgi:hypothetical protein
MGAPSQQQARNTLVWKMRQEIGMCVLRGHAEVIIERARMERVVVPGGGWRHLLLSRLPVIRESPV